MEATNVNTRHVKEENDEWVGFVHAAWHHEFHELEDVICGFGIVEEYI